MPYSTITSLKVDCKELKTNSTRRKQFRQVSIIGSRGPLAGLAGSERLETDKVYLAPGRCLPLLCWMHFIPRRRPLVPPNALAYLTAANLPIPLSMAIPHPRRPARQ